MPGATSLQASSDIGQVSVGVLVGVVVGVGVGGPSHPTDALVSPATQQSLRQLVGNVRMWCTRWAFGEGTPEPSPGWCGRDPTLGGFESPLGVWGARVGRSPE